MSWTSVFAPMPDDRDELEINLKVEDIILDFAGNFCIEIILSASQLELPKLPERLNSLVFVKNWKPYITIEAFEVLDNIFPSYRYPTKVDWVEGTNYFVNHIGKI